MQFTISSYVSINLLFFLPQVREYYGFLPLTAYLAVNYMDRFLSLHRLPVSAQLAAAIAGMLVQILLKYMHPCRSAIHMHVEAPRTYDRLV
jgi:cyclin D1/2/4, plant